MVSLTELQEIPSENMILLVGPPGSGKSTFCQQTILKGLAVDKPIIFVTTEYGPSEAERALKERGLREVEPGLLNFVNVYHETVGLSVSDRPDTVHAHCEDLSSIGIAISKLSERIGRKGVLLVFDSLTSPYLFSGSEVLRFVRMTLSGFAAEGNAVLACFDEGCGKSEDLVAMMSLSNGVIKMEMEKDKQLLDVVKHPKVRPTRIEVPTESKPTGLKFASAFKDLDPNMAKQCIEAMTRGDETWARKEIGDFVNLFWPNLVTWSGMLWDPKRFPTMKYELDKMEGTMAWESIQLLPWYMRLLFKSMPKDLNKVNNMKKLFKFGAPQIEAERSGIMEYLEDRSKPDEHYFRVYESYACCGFENLGAPMAFNYLAGCIAGSAKGFESTKGLERDWNAIETKCIGRGDPYCEFKLVPGMIAELRDTLEKDSTFVERIHDQLMQRLIGFLLYGKPLVERPRLGSDIHLHVVSHAMGFPQLTDERYQMALRMGGAKAGKEVGEHLMKAGIQEGEAVKRILTLLEHCKVGKVTADETIKIDGNCESKFLLMLGLTIKFEEPSCYFTTGFLNGFFSTVKNQHVKETKCIAMGDPYCEWEFR
jgi:predicted hydrocarbon binding protein/KaiC/GvpD/RAD55 family RecA-like ATPase